VRTKTIGHLILNQPGHPQNHLLDLLTQELRKRRLVLFIGAGVSKDAGLPLWNELVTPLRESLALPPSTDAIEVAQRYVNAHGRLALVKYLEVTLGRCEVPGPMHDALAQLPVSVVVTTNYDQLLERAFERRGDQPVVIARDSDLTHLIKDPSIHDHRRPVVVKLHGCLSEPDTIVMTRDDYLAYPSQHQAMIACLQRLLLTQTFLFVGFSLTDCNFWAIHRRIRADLRQSASRAFLLDAVRRPVWIIEKWRSQGVETLFFKDFDAKLTFIRRLAQQTVTQANTSGSAHLPLVWGHEPLATTTPR